MSTFRFQTFVPYPILSQVETLAQEEGSFENPDLQELIALWSRLAVVITNNTVHVADGPPSASVHTETDEYYLLLGKLLANLHR
jgi:hypothetical protein